MTMKLFYSNASPYARKVLALAYELGLDDRITIVPATVSPVSKEKTLHDHNPVGKIPTLVLADGTPLFDSRVIAEYFDSLVPDSHWFPKSGAARWKTLVLQSMADGALDACLLARYENLLRPEDKRWEEWREGQMMKVSVTLETLEKDWVHHLSGHHDIGVIAACCVLGYLDLRFPEFNWRKNHPKLTAWFESYSQRPAMARTAPPKA